MSDFTSNGFDTFPHLYADSQRIHEVAEWDESILERKIGEYGVFLAREDLMARARKTANWIMDNMMFELACWDGVYEEEICQNDLSMTTSNQ